MTVRQVLAEERLFELSGGGYDPAGQVLEAGQAVEPTPGVRALLLAGVLASDARLVSRDGRWQVEGDPTEGALIVAATKAGLNPVELNQQAPRVAEIPFTSERRRMTTLHTTASGVVAFSKGAADEVLASCTSQLRSGEDVPLTESGIEQIRASEQRMAREGLRVLAVARKFAASIEDAESRMTLLGLVAMMDPPRAEARDAVRVCEAAGIRAVMITGDHPLTASTIAGELGMLKNWRVVSGRDLERDERRRSRARRRRHRGVRARVARRQAARRDGLAESRRGRRDDRGRRERRARHQEGRRRHRDGHYRDRREQGSGRHDPARRQLRDDRRERSKRGASSSGTSRST